MRLQLDSSSVGRPGETGHAAPATGSGSDSRGAGSGVAGAQDSIHISGPSSALNRLATDRTARIQQLTAAVQGGSYQVSAPSVSHAVVAHALSS